MRLLGYSLVRNKVRTEDVEDTSDYLSFYCFYMSTLFQNVLRILMYNIGPMSYYLVV